MHTWRISGLVMLMRNYGGDDVEGEYEDSKSMQTWRISGLVSTMLTPASWPRTS